MKPLTMLARLTLDRENHEVIRRYHQQEGLPISHVDGIIHGLDIAIEHAKKETS